MSAHAGVILKTKKKTTIKQTTYSKINNMSAHARVILKTKKKQQLNKQHTVKLTI